MKISFRIHAILQQGRLLIGSHRTLQAHLDEHSKIVVGKTLMNYKPFVKFIKFYTVKLLCYMEPVHVSNSQDL